MTGFYEHRSIAPISRAHFRRRVFTHFSAALVLLVVSIGIGMAGYSYFEGLPWRDGFLNSAMLLGGMGPVDPPKTNSGKLFAGFYALYCGLVFIVGAGLIVGPFVHRLLHKFHWEEK